MIPFKKALTLTMILTIMTSILTCCSIKTISNTRNPVKAGVLLYSFDDELSSLFKQNSEKIQKEKENKMQFSFFDGKGNLPVEDENLNEMIQGDFYLIIATVIDKKKLFQFEFSYF